jgi:hypothetical protein
MKNKAIKTIEIQSVLIKPEFKQMYFCRIDGVVKKISDSKFFKYYDMASTIVLPPITKENK